VEHPEGLWRFLSERRFGEHLSGTVAAIESFGVFVSLDDGPDHPIFPGVGFITYPELSWRHFDSPTDIVQVGQRVTCAFLQHDTWNAEARLSLRALQPTRSRSSRTPTPWARPCTAGSPDCSPSAPSSSSPTASKASSTSGT
jgi:ribosomal protein S1